MRPHALSLLALLGLASSTNADFITGTVVDANGVPVPGVNIDAIRRSNGNNINLANDGTSTAGFFNTTIPADIYDLYIFPPAPPVTTHVTLVLRNVVVVGTKNLGTLQLQAGVQVSGHVQTVGGLPVAQLDLSMTDLLTGFDVPLAVHKTDAFGNFRVAAPKNAIELLFDTSGLLAPTLLSRTAPLSPTADVALGTITMQPGARVAGTLLRAPGGLPLAGIDLDFTDVSTGVKAVTPNDNTNALGNYSVIVPPGTYDVDFSAPLASLMVSRRLANQIIAQDLNMGALSLDPGVVLSGTIRSLAGVIQANSDVDVYLSSGEKVFTPGDRSSTLGTYQLIAPTGNLKVVFHPPDYVAPLASDVHANVFVSANTTLDGVLPPCPRTVNYGAGLAGTGGFVPHLSVSGGTVRTGNPNFAYELSLGRGGALAWLLVSIAPNSQPLFGGRLLVLNGAGNSVSMFMQLGGAAGVAGAGSYHLPVPSLGPAEGFTLFSQFLVRDPSTPKKWSMSEGLAFKVCP